MHFTFAGAISTSRAITALGQGIFTPLYIGKCLYPKPLYEQPYGTHQGDRNKRYYQIPDHCRFIDFPTPRIP